MSVLLVACGVPRVERRVPSSLGVSWLYTEGMKAELMGDVEGATRLFEAVIEVDSSHAPSYFELAGLLVPDDRTRAMEYARRASVLEPQNVWYRMLEGRLMVLSGDYARAQAIYEELTRLAPHNPENYRMLAALHEQQGSPYAAIATLTGAQERLGVHAALQQMLGSLYFQTGQDSLGLEALERALQLAPADPEALFTLATYYRSKGRFQEFFATARRLAASPEGDVGPKIALIEELKANRNFYNEHFFAIRDLIVTLLTQYPRDYRLIELYGMALTATNGVEQGVEFFKGNLSDSAPVEAFRTVLEMETFLRRPDSLARYAALALRRFPGDPDLYLRLGGSYAYLGESAEALEAYRLLLRHAPDDSLRSVAYGAIGDLYHNDSNTRLTYKYYERALKADPDNAMVLNNYSYYLSTDGPTGRDLPRAVAMAERAIRLATGNATYLDTYAWALYKAGRLPEAKKVMQQAVSLDPSDSETLYDHYGDILHALGETFMARLYWQKALDKNPDNPDIIRKLN